MADKKASLEDDGAPALLTDIVRISRSGTGSLRLDLQDVRDLIRGDIVTDSTTSRDATNDDDGMYIRFTSASAKSYLLPDDASSDALAAGFECRVRNMGAGNLVITASTDVMINSPAGADLTLVTNETRTIKRVGSGEFDVF
jgi:hypothetical protein